MDRLCNPLSSKVCKPLYYLHWYGVRDLVLPPRSFVPDPTQWVCKARHAAAVDLSRRCMAVTGAELRAVAQKCHRLQSLDLGYCTALEEEVIVEAVGLCAHLRTLILRGCDQVPATERLPCQPPALLGPSAVDPLFRALLRERCEWLFCREDGSQTPDGRCGPNRRSLWAKPTAVEGPPTAVGLDVVRQNCKQSPAH